MTGGCANVTTGNATGCPWPNCTLAGASIWTGPTRAGKAGGRPLPASAASSPTDLALRWDGQRILVIGHVATRWGLDHFIGGVPLEDLAEQDFGLVAEIDNGTTTAPGVLQAHLPTSRVVRAFSMIDAPDMSGDGHPKGDPKRRALALA